MTAGFAEVVPVPPAVLDAAADAAGVPRDAVAKVAAGYAAWVALERAGCSLNDGRAALGRARKAAAGLRRAAFLPPVVVALGGVENKWPAAAARAVRAAAEFDRLAAAAGQELEARAARFVAGGKRNLTHLLAEPAKVRLARELAALLPPGTATTTVGGRLFRLVAAVHAAVTGRDEGGVAAALRASGVARTSLKKRGSRDDLPARACSDVGMETLRDPPCAPTP